MTETSDSAFRRFLRAAAEESTKGALAGGTPGIVLGSASIAAAGAGVGAIGGAAVGAFTQARRELLPSNDERVAAADIEATTDASRSVPAVSARVDEIERADASTRARLDELTAALGKELSAAYRARVHERTVEVAATLLKLVADGHATPEEVDTPEGRFAVAETIRAALEALCPEAVPAIARLNARRPVDHFFRGTCRVLVDLDADELAALRGLIATGASRLAYLFAWPGIERHRVFSIELHRAADAAGGEAVIWTGFPTEMVYEAPSEALPLRHRSPIYDLLIAHRLAATADDGSVVQSVGERFRVLDVPDLRIFIIEMRTLLDLHFVLSGERIVDPRTQSVDGRSAG